MKTKRIFRLLAIFVMIIASYSLRSEDFFSVKDKVISDSNFKVGLFYFKPLLLLENVGYTSNIFTYVEKDIPDWTGDFGLGLRVSAIVANRLILQAEDVPIYSFYLNNESLRSWSNHFGATAYSYLGPMNLKAQFTLNDMTQRPYDEFSLPFQFSEREWSGEIDFGRRSNLFLTAYSSFSQLAYEEDPYMETYYLAESLNRRESIVGIKLNRRIFTGTIIYLNFELSDFSFASNSARDSHAQSIGLGLDLPSIGAIRGNVLMSFRRLDPKNADFKDSQNLNGRGNIYISLFDRLRLNFFYELGSNFSFSANELFYNRQSVGVGADVYLTRFLKCGATYQKGSLKYQSFLNLEFQRTDLTNQQRYYLAVPFFGNTSLGFAYTINSLRSDALNLNYTRSFWGGFITYEF